jgi:hypothetical protein
MSEGSPTESTTDRTGATVTVGTVVRVLAIRPSVLERLTEQESARVQSMLGKAFTVYEVDRWGGAWVEQWWHESEDQATSHSLALAPTEMEVVSDGRA